MLRSAFGPIRGVRNHRSASRFDRLLGPGRSPSVRDSSPYAGWLTAADGVEVRCRNVLHGPEDCCDTAYLERPGRHVFITGPRTRSATGRNSTRRRLSATACAAGNRLMETVA